MLNWVLRKFKQFYAPSFFLTGGLICDSTVNSEIFGRLFTRIIVKDICGVKNSRLMHDSPHISEGRSDFVISQAFYFRENKTLAIISESTAPKSHETASAYI